MYISVTRLHIKGKRILPSFYWYTVSSIIQVKKAKGLIYSSYTKDDFLTYWTLSVWENKDLMTIYRNNGNHLKAMKISRELADELEYTSWEANNVPNWKECKNRLYMKYGKNIDN